MKSGQERRLINPTEVAAAFEILRMPAVRQGLTTLLDAVAPDLQFILMVDGVDYYPSPVMSQITTKYWAPVLRLMVEWQLCTGVIPYYYVPLASKMGDFVTLFDPSFALQRVPVCPVHTEGNLWTEPQKIGTDPIVIGWNWRQGLDDGSSDGVMHFEIDDSTCPDRVTGCLRSVVSSLFPEFQTLVDSRKAMLIAENLRLFPPLIMERAPERFPQGRGIYTTDTTNAIMRTGDLVGEDEIPILEEHAEAAQYAEEARQARLLAEAADNVYAHNWLGGVARKKKTPGDMAFDQWKTRRYLLPKGVTLAKCPESKGITREQYNKDQREFEDHAAALIGFESTARAPHSTTRVGVNAHTRTAMMATLRHRQTFAPILASMFGAANWQLFESQLRRGGVTLEGADAERVIAHWAAGHVRVDLGELLPGVDEDGNPVAADSDSDNGDPGVPKDPDTAPPVEGPKRDREAASHDPTVIEAYDGIVLGETLDKQKRKKKKRKKAKTSPGEMPHQQQLRNVAAIADAH